MFAKYLTCKEINFMMVMISRLCLKVGCDLKYKGELLSTDSFWKR